MNNHDVVLAPDVVIDACFREGDQHQVARNVIQRSLSDGYRVWQYTGSVHQIAQARQEPRSAMGGGQIWESLHHQCQWLAALAEDGDVFDSEDPSAQQLAKAVQRLGQAILVTSNQYLLKHCQQAITCQDFLSGIAPVSPIEFIDLRAQQDQIRPQLERGIFNVLRHGQYILGPEITTMEQRLAAFVGVKHCVAVASGTDSLLIALMALGVSANDEVITVPYTWISTAEVISLLGAKPVFVDIEAETFNMDVDLLEAAITPRTKAIMPVCLYGQCPDMDRINAIADRHGIPVIEDAAQSFGATFRGRRSCGLSVIGSTSFFPSKPLGCYGDSGALFTSDDRLADLFRQIRIHGQKKKHHHDVIGINGRMDTLQAAIVLAKLDVFETECEARTQCAERYTSLILERRRKWGVADDKAMRLINPPVVAAGNTSVFAQYTIMTDYNEAVRAYLQSHGVPSVTYYAVPLHLQPAFAYLGYGAASFPVSEQVAGRGLSLPMSPGLRPSDQQRIADLIFTAIDRGMAPPANL